MEARSLLRQAPCPECGKPGYGSDTGSCAWCDQRDKACQAILDMPADETTAPTTPLLAVFWREVIKAADSMGLKKGMGLDVSLGWDVIEAARHATRSPVEPTDV